MTASDAAAGVLVGDARRIRSADAEPDFVTAASIQALRSIYNAICAVNRRLRFSKQIGDRLEGYERKRSLRQHPLDR
jgi:hypothetical protein